MMTKTMNWKEATRKHNQQENADNITKFAGIDQHYNTQCKQCSCS